MTGERQRFLVRERHVMRFPGVSLDLGHEPVFVLGTSGEPAMALEHLLHDSSRRR